MNKYRLAASVLGAAKLIDLMIREVQGRASAASSSQSHINNAKSFLEKPVSPSRHTGSRPNCQPSQASCSFAGAKSSKPTQMRWLETQKRRC